MTKNKKSVPVEVELEEDSIEMPCPHCLELELRFNHQLIHGIMDLLVEKKIMTQEDAEVIFEEAAAQFYEENGEEETPAHLQN